MVCISAMVIIHKCSQKHVGKLVVQVSYHDTQSTCINHGIVEILKTSLVLALVKTLLK